MLNLFSWKKLYWQPTNGTEAFDVSHARSVVYAVVTSPTLYTVVAVASYLFHVLSHLLCRAQVGWHLVE
jgi:hypothetical protein